MKKAKLPDFLKEHYKNLKKPIRMRLEELSRVPERDYFYELCFCICTPQSRARNAYQVESILRERDFLNKPFDPVDILFDKKHYIRFHNQKAQRLLAAREQFPEISALLKSDKSPIEKRNWIFENVKGVGMKESSHYLRNIGYRGLAILDRHILKHLVFCGLFEEIPKVGSKKQYLAIEEIFSKFASDVNIPLDELDLLFWSYETGEILK